MKNYYYLIWADAIQKSRYNRPNEKRWKLIVFAIITYINALNIYCIDLWLSVLGIYSIPIIYIDLFSLSFLNNILTFVVMYASYFIILNYFLIFYKDRYKKIIQKYPMVKRNYAGIYLLISIFIAVLTILIYALTHHSKTIITLNMGHQQCI